MTRSTDTQNTRWAAAEAATRELETAACDAVVPGDLRPWCEALLPPLERAHAAWRDYAPEERAVLDEIAAADDGLTQRVEALREAADRVGGELDRLRASVRELLSADLDAPAASAEPTKRLEGLRRDVLACVVDARAHHGEVGTWLHESANRDRGVRD